MVTLTPEARKRPPKRLLKIWLPSKVAVAWLVISIPEEEEGQVRLRPCDPPAAGGRAAGSPTGGKAVKDAVLAEDGVAVGADQHAGLGVPEDVVLLQQACTRKRVKKAGERRRRAATPTNRGRR